MPDLDRIAEAAQNFKHFFMRSFGAEDARDLVNDLFIIAARTKMRDPATLLPFMVTVARRLVVKRIRWKHVRRNTAAYQDEAEALPNRTSSPEQELIRSEKLDRVQGWMHRLKAVDRELFDVSTSTNRARIRFSAKWGFRRSNSSSRRTARSGNWLQWQRVTNLEMLPRGNICAWQAQSFQSLRRPPHCLRRSLNP